MEAHASLSLPPSLLRAAGTGTHSVNTSVPKCTDVWPTGASLAGASKKPLVLSNLQKRSPDLNVLWRVDVLGGEASGLDVRISRSIIVGPRASRGAGRGANRLPGLFLGCGLPCRQARSFFLLSPRLACGDDPGPKKVHVRARARLGAGQTGVCQSVAATAARVASYVIFTCRPDGLRRGLTGCRCAPCCGGFILFFYFFVLRRRWHADRPPRR